MIVITIARKAVTKPIIKAAQMNEPLGLNIDDCRLAAGDDYADRPERDKFKAGDVPFFGGLTVAPGTRRALADGVPVGHTKPHEGGRWPANIILGHLQSCQEGCSEDCPIQVFDKQSGISKSTADKIIITRSANSTWANQGGRFSVGRTSIADGYGDCGGASRFFKQVKE